MGEFSLRLGARKRFDWALHDIFSEPFRDCRDRRTDRLRRGGISPEAVVTIRRVGLAHTNVVILIGADDNTPLIPPTSSARPHHLPKHPMDPLLIARHPS